MKKKKLLFLFLCLCVLASGVIAMASTTIVRRIEIQKGENDKETPVVGTSLSAYIEAKNDISSQDDLGVFVYAGWVGWPMTREFTTQLRPGAYIDHTENQSELSNFQLAIAPYLMSEACNGWGEMTVVIE